MKFRFAVQGLSISAARTGYIIGKSAPFVKIIFIRHNTAPASSPVLFRLAIPAELYYYTETRIT